MRKLPRRIRERILRQAAAARNTGGTLLRGTRTHKSGKEYDRREGKNISLDKHEEGR